MRELIRHQSGVVSRAQLLSAGCHPHDIARMVRRRELNPMSPGVYVDHTGEPSWLQRAWAAVLMCRSGSTRSGEPVEESAALRGRSALIAEAGSRGHDTQPVEVVISDERRVTERDGVLVQRSSSLLMTSRWHVAPPRVPYDHAVLDVAAGTQRMVDLVAELARAVGSRRTTAPRLLQVVNARPRLRQRHDLVAVLRDLGEGTCSALEHGHAMHVERAHALPRAVRQSRGRSRTGVIYRDARYGALVVELDGRAWHDSAEQRDLDADRDLVAAVSGLATVRLTWGQVYDRPCWTAAQLARLLGVAPRRCGTGCGVLESRLPTPVQRKI